MTIKDIARLSGYGIGTVSRVINNHPDVSDKAREKILETIREHNFQPNSNARHLKMQASTSLVIIVKGTQNILFADIVEQMQELLTNKGENTSIYYIDEDANEVSRAIQLCTTRNPKGIVFLGGNLEYFKKDFAQIDIPCILITNDAESLEFDNLSSVTTCDEDGAQAAIDYLIANGHQDIGVIGGTLSDTQISYRRIQGVLKSFDEHGLAFDLVTQYEPCRFSMDAGFQAAGKLLSRRPDLTAIFAVGDLIAVGAMRAIRDSGKRVPDDISVIGYDGIALSRYCIPRLTTISQDTKQLAKQGVDLILQRINYPYHAAHKKTPFRLVEGESVGQRA